MVVQVGKKVGCSHACKLQGPWLRGAGEAAVRLQRSAAVRLGQRATPETRAGSGSRDESQARCSRGLPIT